MVMHIGRAPYMQQQKVGKQVQQKGQPSEQAEDWERGVWGPKARALHQALHATGAGRTGIMNAVMASMAGEIPGAGGKGGKQSVLSNAPSAGKGAPASGKANGAPVVSSANADASTFKVLLHEAMSKQAGRNLTKDELLYDAIQIEGEVPPKWQATVAIGDQEYAGELAENKKKAENNAALIALSALFGFSAADLSVLKGQQPQGMKRKAEAQGNGAAMKQAKNSAADPADNRKSKLCDACTLLLGRPIAKADLVYTTVPVEGTGNFVSTVLISETNESFKGRPSPSGKQAEHAAAETALNQLKRQIEPLKKEREEKKQATITERLAALKQRTAAKKAAQKLEGGEN